jgi:hypothetical protein
MNATAVFLPRYYHFYWFFTPLISFFVKVFDPCTTFAYYTPPLWHFRKVYQSYSDASSFSLVQKVCKSPKAYQTAQPTKPSSASPILVPSDKFCWGGGRSPFLIGNKMIRTTGFWNTQWMYNTHARRDSDKRCRQELLQSLPSLSLRLFNSY